MNEFLSMIVDFLSIQITLGSFTTPLGSLLFFFIIIKYFYERFYGEFLNNQYLNEQARKHGFSDWHERERYDNYMGGAGGNSGNSGH